MAKWSDEELDAAYGRIGGGELHKHSLRAVAALVVERLAQGEVDAEALADGIREWSINAFNLNNSQGTVLAFKAADAIRLALAQQAARWDRERRQEQKQKLP